ncbi:MAG: hypothetical protein WCD42_02780 [Rhizomicrobium sp.]
MSLRLTADVLDYAPYDGGTLLVLLALASWANDDGTRIFPRIEAMAAKARLGVRATQYALRQLEEDGVLSVVSAGRGRKTTEYRLEVQKMHLWPQDVERPKQRCKKCTSAAAPLPLQPAAPQRCNSCTTEVQSATATIDTLSGTLLSDPVTAPRAVARKRVGPKSMTVSTPQTGSGVTTSCAETSAAPLVPTERGRALAAWPQIWAAFMAVPGASAVMSEAKARGTYARLLSAGVLVPAAEDLIAAIGVYAAEVAAANAKRRGDGLRIPHPHTWLADQRWQQYAAAARSMRMTQQNLAVRACDAADGLGAAGFERLRRAGIALAEIEAWFTGCVGETDGTVPVIVAPSPFKARAITERYLERLQKEDAFGPELKILCRGRRAA